MNKCWRWIGRVAKTALLLLLCELTILGWLVACVARSEDIVGAPGPADAIVILGAQVKPWGEASETLLRRMQLALAHYQEEPRLIVCCGGQGVDEPVAEGDFMRQWMLEQGVPEDLVVSENTSRNTRENIAGAKAILEARGLTTALIITSDYHLPRALATCDQAGLPATGDGSLSNPQLWWKNHVRESLSWIKFWLGR